MVNQNCVKCGNSCADIKYHGHKTEVMSFVKIGDGVEVNVNTDLSSKEILELTCNKCEYVWVEKPLDVANKEEVMYV